MRIRSLVQRARRAAARTLDPRRGNTPAQPPDLEPAFFAHYTACKPFTMTSLERLYALHETVRYIVRAGIAGDIVECGVWRGGSMMMVASTLRALDDTFRQLYLYDTFEGMPAPTSEDVDLRGAQAGPRWRAEQSGDRNTWCFAPLDDVTRNVGSTGYPRDRLTFVKGKVEDTIPATIPERIAVLRLDTDWYTSTKHLLEHLYPRLVRGGVLIIDDYGHWQGCRQAVDEYFTAHGPLPLLSRIDYTGRMLVRP